MTEHEAAARWWIDADPTIAVPAPGEHPPAARAGPGVTGSQPGVLAARLPGHLPPFVSGDSAPPGTAAAPVAPTPGAAATP